MRLCLVASHCRACSSLTNLHVSNNKSLNMPSQFHRRIRELEFSDAFNLRWNQPLLLLRGLIHSPKHQISEPDSFTRGCAWPGVSSTSPADLQPTMLRELIGSLHMPPISAHRSTNCTSLSNSSQRLQHKNRIYLLKIVENYKDPHNNRHYFITLMYCFIHHFLPILR